MLSGAKDLLCSSKTNKKQIPRFARDDMIATFAAAC